MYPSASLRVRIGSGYALAQGTHWLRVRIRVGYAFAQGMPVSDGFGFAQPSETVESNLPEALMLLL